MRRRPFSFLLLSDPLVVTALRNLLDINALRLPKTPPAVVATSRSRPPHHAKGELFLKGPIPWSWLVAAGDAKGRALQVAIVLWLEVGMKRSARVRLPHQRLREMGVDRHAVRRGLAALEAAGLVVVERRNGASPVVTVRPAGPGSEGDAATG